MTVATLAISQVSIAFPSSSSWDTAIGTDPDSIGARSTLDNLSPVKYVSSEGSDADGLEALASIYRKFDRPIPKDLETTLSQHEKRDSFHLTTWDNIKNVFVVQVNIGLPKKKFDLVLDTTSSGVWVLSSQAANPDLQPSYNPERSLSAERMKGYSWEIKHLNGKQASGDVYRDFVSFYTSMDSITSRSQAVQVANDAYLFRNLKGVSGVMGMGFSSGSPIKPKPQPNMFDNIAEELDEKVFTIDIVHRGIGVVEFGYIDSHVHEGEIGYADVLKDQNYWNFTIGGLSSDFITHTTDDVVYAIADTTSALVLLPMQYIVPYYNQVPDAVYKTKYNGFVFPCNSQMPNFVFDVGGVEISIPGAYLIFSPMHGDEGLCFGALQPSNDLGFNVLGTPAFKSSFVVFNPADAKIGWAKKKLRRLGVNF
ncbi:uncharacterized protein BROUX77_001649 [Berkeleyomyces rouxiae]|uniref:uncharacterized protein n=1 Tax=Berkeleyomyces rouxiae TaxID=2035830 RepID=UPI003B79445B